MSISPNNNSPSNYFYDGLSSDNEANWAEFEACNDEGSGDDFACVEDFGDEAFLDDYYEEQEKSYTVDTKNIEHTGNICIDGINVNGKVDVKGNILVCNAKVSSKMMATGDINIKLDSTCECGVESKKNIAVGGSFVTSEIKACSSISLTNATVTCDEAKADLDINLNNSKVSGKLHSNRNININDSENNCESSFASGDVFVNGSKVSGEIKAEDRVVAKNCEALGKITAKNSIELSSCSNVTSISTQGTVLLSQSKILGDVITNGGNIENSKVGGTLSCSSNSLIIKNSYVQTLILSPQTITIYDSIIEDVIFDGANGHVILAGNSEIINDLKQVQPYRISRPNLTIEYLREVSQKIIETYLYLDIQILKKHSECREKDKADLLSKEDCYSILKALKKNTFNDFVERKARDIKGLTITFDKNLMDAIVKDGESVDIFNLISLYKELYGNDSVGIKFKPEKYPVMCPLVKVHGKSVSEISLDNLNDVEKEVLQQLLEYCPNVSSLSCFGEPLTIPRSLKILELKEVKEQLKIETIFNSNVKSLTLRNVTLSDIQEFPDLNFLSLVNCYSLKYLVLSDRTTKFNFCDSKDGTYVTIYPVAMPYSRYISIDDMSAFANAFKNSFNINMIPSEYFRLKPQDREHARLVIFEAINKANAYFSEPIESKRLTQTKENQQRQLCDMLQFVKYKNLPVFPDNVLVEIFTTRILLDSVESKKAI